MEPDRRIYLYEIEAVPDCTHHSLVALCGGNVREHIFRSFEHVLRMVANFQEGQMSLAIRFLFHPDTDKGIQHRLKLQLAVRIGEGISVNTVRQLIDTGPLSEFYGIRQIDQSHNDFLFDHDFGTVCEVIRQEDSIKPFVTKKDSEDHIGNIPAIYYSVYPFEARADNDYLMIDTLLSKMDNPCVIEMLVSPVNQKNDLEAQYKYITQLKSINEYGDDSYSNPEPQKVFGKKDPNGDLLGQQTQRIEADRKRDPMADDFVQEHQEFHRKLRQPQLLFNIKAFARNQENALMLASAIAECGFSAGKYNLICYGKASTPEKREHFENSRKRSVQLDIFLDAMQPRIWTDDLPDIYQDLGRLCRMATVDELKGIVRLPVGGHGSPRCIRKSTDPLMNVDSNSILIGDDLESKDAGEREFNNLSNLTQIFHPAEPTILESRLPLATLTKHMFVAGVPGSGKTTAVYNLLVQLFRADIPFLVIEPAKTEYRVLKTLQNHPDASVREMAEQLRIYSPGNDRVSPMRFNPLYFPPGLTLEEHSSQILSCFEAAMPMGGPLQALIAEAVEEVYKHRELSGIDPDFPRMDELAEAAGRIMENKKYEGEIKSNLRAAIEVRLGMLTRQAMGRIFQANQCIPSIPELLSRPTIVEMDSLSQGHACLLTLFLLSAIREHIRIDPQRRHKGLHHVTIIEEAHNIVGRAGAAKASEEIADPKAFAAEYISRMLAELRALGEGIIIADQLPSAVAPEVVKNTGTKLAHRLVSNEDREDLGGAMLLGGTEIEEIARLKPGEAYFYTEGLHLPRRVRCLNANAYLGLTDFVDSESLGRVLAEQQWFNDNKIKRMSLFSDNLRRIQKDARQEAEEHRKKLGKLQRKYDEITDEKERDGEEIFRKKSDKLIEDSMSHAEEVDEAIDKFEAKFETLRSFSLNSIDELAKIDKEPFDVWDEKIYPDLEELSKDFYSIESDLQEL